MALLGALCSSALGKTNYVSTTGSDADTGADWAHAWGSISNAMTNAVNGDTILVSNGTYYVTEPILVNNAVTISGYPPNTNTVVTRMASVTNRLFIITHSNAVVEYLAITNGNANASIGGVWQTGGGGAINMSGGTLRNCLVEKNAFQTWGVGGALHMLGNSTVSNCVFRYNGLPGGTYGGTIGVYPSSSGTNCHIADCAFIGGTAYPVIYLPAGTVERCTFSLNTPLALQMVGGTVRECIFEGNISGGSGAAVSMSGGVLTNCVIRNNNMARYGSGVYMTGGLVMGCTITNNKATAWGCYEGAGVWMSDGAILNTLIADNVLPEYSRDGAGVYMTGGQLLSCTIADNRNTGVLNNVGGTQTGGGIYYGGGAVSNCIIYGNTTAKAGDDDNLSGAGVTNACWYSCSPGLVNTANSNITANPLFVGGGDYHLKSRSGHWTSMGWVNDASDSPCIDKGPPGWDYSLEPKYNGGRINMGAYANTEQASKSWRNPGTVVLLR